MGCDIHLHVEVKKGLNKYKEPSWICGDYFRLNPYYKAPEARNSQDQEDNDPWVTTEKYHKTNFCEDRNYDLFSVLANVRNYGGNDYIDEPRGVPEDASQEIKDDYASWGMDGHSASYFTLKELINWQKEQRFVRHSGLVSAEEAENLDEYGTLPTMWCQGTTSDGWVYREWSTENKVLQPLIDSLIKRGYEYWLFYHEDQIEEDADKIRIIFWFDS